MSEKTRFSKKDTIDKPLTRSELNIVYMKYFEGLDDLEVAKRLGLQLDQVKGKIKSPIVENYICDVVLPYKQRQRISKIKALLADSIKTVDLLALSGILAFSLLAIFTINTFL